jgi:ubiquinone/menaquinone biosynthesis C-methylase UbiE
MVIPRLNGLEEQLREGIHVADVGCGAGVALLELAKAFPDSEFHGYEISHFALERAAENRSAAGITNAYFHDVKNDPLPQDGRFRFITTFDCLHDMTRPDEVMVQIRKAMHDEGSWLIADIKALPSYEENVAKNPMASMMYGTSIITCMSSALSEPDGMGLGTLGLHPELAREMAEVAGFSQFETIDMKHPVNAFYWVRP